MVLCRNGCSLCFWLLHSIIKKCDWNILPVSASIFISSVYNNDGALGYYCMLEVKVSLYYLTWTKTQETHAVVNSQNNADAVYWILKHPCDRLTNLKTNYGNRREGASCHLSLAHISKKYVRHYHSGITWLEDASRWRPGGHRPWAAPPVRGQTLHRKGRESHSQLSCSTVITTKHPSTD